MCVCVCVCVCACSYVCIILALTRVKGLGTKVGCVHFIKHPGHPFVYGSGLGTSLVSKAVWYVGSPTLLLQDSVDAISTMWTHTGYIP